MMRLIICSIILFGFFACTPNARRPKFVPDEEGMAELLADVYEVEAAISQNGRVVNRDDKKFVGYYKDVLDKHEITKFEFDSAVSWYSSHPLLFADVYDDVISILSKKDALLKKELNAENESNVEKMGMIPDVKDYWNERRKYKLPLDEKDSIASTIPYSVLLDSISSGIVRLHASYTFTKGNQLDSAQMYMIACFVDSTRDTLTYQIRKSFKKTSGNLSLSIPMGKKLLSLEGLLFEHDTTRIPMVQIDDVKLTFVPRVEPKNLR